MEKLGFLRSQQFSKCYSIITNAVLSFSLIFSILGIFSIQIIQSIAGLMIILGFCLLLGQILLVLNLVNKDNKIGWILVRFSYVTLFVAILGMLSIVGGVFITSFDIIGRNATSLFSSFGMTSLTSFGICLSGICFHTYSIENIWKLEM